MKTDSCSDQHLRHWWCVSVAPVYSAGMCSLGCSPAAAGRVHYSEANTQSQSYCPSRQADSAAKDQMQAKGFSLTVCYYHHLE